VLIDTAISADSNFTQKEVKKKVTKHIDLENAVGRMWKVRTQIVAVIIGALETIKKGLD